MSQLKTWVRKKDWRERVITADPSWFTVPMGTGVCTQLLTKFPYPSYWLRNLAYCFWIADICLFAFFTVLGVTRAMLYPRTAKTVFDDFSQTSYLGAIVVAFETIILGVITFYSHHPAGYYTAEVMFWIAVVMSSLVAFGGVFLMSHRQQRHSLSDVTGAWFLSFIPCIVCSTVGGSVAPYLPYKNAISVVVVSFLLWSLGITMSLAFATIYIWRLMSCHLPQRAAIVSTFVPVGPFGMGAYSTQQMAKAFTHHLSKQEFILQSPPHPPSSSITVIAECIHWGGIILALVQLAVASFFLVEGCVSVCSKVPKAFNVGFWSFVFPCGVYSNAWNIMSTDLRNDGMKGWAATCTVATVLLWLFCALSSLYSGVWKGKLFFAPGLQGWAEKQADSQREIDSQRSKAEPDNQHGLVRDIEDKHSSFRESSADGSYKVY